MSYGILAYTEGRLPEEDGVGQSLSSVNLVTISLTGIEKTGKGGW